MPWMESKKMIMRAFIWVRFLISQPHTLGPMSKHDLIPLIFPNYSYMLIVLQRSFSLFRIWPALTSTTKAFVLSPQNCLQDNDVSLKEKIRMIYLTTAEHAYLLRLNTTCSAPDFLPSFFFARLSSKWTLNCNPPQCTDVMVGIQMQS